jgi:hypothetical protein
MLMQDYYSSGKEKKALYAQTTSFVIFSLIWLYAWIFWWKRSYLLPQLLFVWPVIKWYLNLFNKKFDINWKFLLFISIIVLCIIYNLPFFNLENK